MRSLLSITLFVLTSITALSAQSSDPTAPKKDAIDYTDLSQWTLEVTMQSEKDDPDVVLQVIILAPNNLYGGDDLVVAYGNVSLSTKLIPGNIETGNVDCKGEVFNGDYLQPTMSYNKDYCFTSLLKTPELYRQFETKKSKYTSYQRDVKVSSTVLGTVTHEGKTCIEVQHVVYKLTDDGLRDVLAQGTSLMDCKPVKE